VGLGSLATRRDCDRRVCVTCGWSIRSYTYRCHPAKSGSFERCIGLAWCSKCRIYTGTMVYVRRAEVLVNALAGLPAERQAELRRSESMLIDFLD
jgi:hypothetical protein